MKRPTPKETGVADVLGGALFAGAEAGAGGPILPAEVSVTNDHESERLKPALVLVKKPGTGAHRAVSGKQRVRRPSPRAPSSLALRS
jgi:hypothetical protein